MTDISSDTAIANLTNSVAATLAKRFSRVANVIDDFGAVGDGSTNDTIHIQTAINSCAGVAVLFFPLGHTFNVSGLTVPSNSHLVIDGKIFLISGSNGPIINLLGSNYLIEGCGTLDGNKSNNQFGGLGAGGIITNTYNPPPPSIPFSNIVIRNITIQNVSNWPVSINSASNVLIDGTSMINSGNAPQCAYGSQFVRFVNNYVSNIPDYGWAFYQGCSYGVCCNNVFMNTATIGALNDGTVSSSSWNSVPQHDLIFNGNVVENAPASGIRLLNVTSSSSANFYNIKLSDNLLVNTGGILLGDLSNTSVENNVIRGGGTSGANWTGILVAGTATYCVVRGNTISNGGQNGASAAYGISQSILYSDISNNHFYDDQAKPTLQYAFAGGLEPTSTYLWNTYQNLANGVFTQAPSSAVVFIGQSTLVSYELVFNNTLVNFSSTGYGISSFPIYGLSISFNQVGTNEVDFYLGAGTGTTGGFRFYQLNSSGTVRAGTFETGAIIRSDNVGNFGALSLTIGSSSGPTWTSASGAPSSKQPIGSLYSNTTGSTGARLYVSAGNGSWNAVQNV